MAIITSGPDQNSYVTMEEANILLLSMRASFMTAGDQLHPTDEDVLLEAARDIDQLWEFNGIPATVEQAVAWPRQYVMKPGWNMPCEPGWSTPWDYSSAIQFKIDYLTVGRSAVPYVDSTVVPREIKEAQALIALLRDKGKNLVGDTQGDTQGLQLDVGFKIAYVNAIRDSADVHKRLAGYGRFIGDSIMRTPNV